MTMKEQQFTDPSNIHRKPALPHESKLSALLFTAQLAVQDRDYSCAEELARKAIALCPRDGAAHNLLAGVFDKTGRTKASLAQLRKAIEIDPADPIPQCNLAIILHNHGRPEESLSALEQLFSHPGRHDQQHAPIFEQATNLHFEVQKTLAQKRSAEVARALDEVRRSIEGVSGYPIRIQIEPLSPAADGCVAIAPLSGRDYHLIRCSSQLPPLVRHHVIAHELAHIQLEFEASAAGKARHFFTDHHVRKFISGLYAEQKAELRQQGWKHDAIERAVCEDFGFLQAVLLNRPMDLVVETWIRRHLPCLSAAQFIAFQFNHDLDQAMMLSPTENLARTDTVRPVALRRVSLALDCVRAWVHDSFFPGVTAFSQSHRHPDVLPLAQKLWAHWQRVSSSLAPGDEYALIDAFANILGLSQAYESKTYSLTVPPARPPQN